MSNVIRPKRWEFKDDPKAYRGRVVVIRDGCWIDKIANFGGRCCSFAAVIYLLLTLSGTGWTGSDGDKNARTGTAIPTLHARANR